MLLSSYRELIHFDTQGHLYRAQLPTFTAKVKQPNWVFLIKYIHETISFKLVNIWPTIVKMCNNQRGYISKLIFIDSFNNFSRAIYTRIIMYAFYCIARPTFTSEESGCPFPIALPIDTPRTYLTWACYPDPHRRGSATCVVIALYTSKTWSVVYERMSRKYLTSVKV